jgi:hypothetical protein
MGFYYHTIVRLIQCEESHCMYTNWRITEKSLFVHIVSAYLNLLSVHLIILQSLVNKKWCSCSFTAKVLQQTVSDDETTSWTPGYMLSSSPASWKTSTQKLGNLSLIQSGTSFTSLIILQPSTTTRLGQVDSIPLFIVPIALKHIFKLQT